MHTHTRPPFLSSLDHNMGIQYTLTALVFLSIGSSELLMTRWQFADPRPGLVEGWTGRRMARLPAGG